MNWMSPNPFPTPMRTNPRRKHKDVEFHVEGASMRGVPVVYRTFDEAAGIAVARASATGDKVNIDVVIWSESGARAYAGDEGVEMYREDPEASVFERIVVKADHVGRIR